MAMAEQTLKELQTVGLAEVDASIAELIDRELERQRDQMELIASENFTWPAVLEAVGSVLTNKYAEGYPGRRYYGGCEWVDEVEQLAIDRAKELFGADHANVQPHAGGPANLAAYFAMLKPGDSILGLRLDHGGHLTHGLKVNFSGLLYDVHAYGVHREDSRIDFDEVRRLAHEHKPKLIVAGASAYPRVIDAAGLPRDRRRGRRPPDGRHGALLRPGRRRPPPEPGRVRRRGHLDHPQDACRPAGRPGAVPRGARCGGRQGRLPGTAGRAAVPRDRRQGRLLQAGVEPGVPRVPGADRPQRPDAGGRCSWTAASSSSPTAPTCT